MCVHVRVSAAAGGERTSRTIVRHKRRGWRVHASDCSDNAGVCCLQGRVLCCAHTHVSQVPHSLSGTGKTGRSLFCTGSPTAFPLVCLIAHAGCLDAVFMQSNSTLAQLEALLALCISFECARLTPAAGGDSTSTGFSVVPHHATGCLADHVCA